MSLDAMKQALSAIEFADMYIKEIVTGSTNRIVAENLLRESGISLRAAIEQAQEPVAWMNPAWIDPDTRGWASESFESIPIEGWLPLYTAPRQWQGLTDKEVKNCYFVSRADFVVYARAIEAKLKEKNSD